MAKTPAKTDKEQYIGIELEFFALKTRKLNAVYSKHKINQWADLGRDGSIRPPNMEEYQSAEIRILCQYKDLPEVMPILQDYLNEVRAKVNKSCGLHVHLDMRNHDAAKAFSNLISRQDEMFKSIASDRRSSQYCTKLSSTKSAKIITALSMSKVTEAQIKKELNELIAKFGATNSVRHYTVEDLALSIFHGQGNGIKNEATHYDGISANPILSGKYSTLEVRIHEATTNCNEIRRWCRYLYDVAFSGELTSLSKNYIEKRINKHA